MGCSSSIPVANKLTDADAGGNDGDVLISKTNEKVLAFRSYDEPEENRFGIEESNGLDQNKIEIQANEESLTEEGENPFAATETQLILEKALRELRDSLYNSKSTRDAHGDMPASTSLLGETTYVEDLGYKVAVVDVGSGFCKAGLSGEDIPSVVIPTVVGRLREDGLIPGINGNEAFIGNDAKLRREALIFSNPIERGVVRNWDDVENVCEHILHMELSLEPGDHGVIMPISPVSTRGCREKLTELMFEKFDVKKLYLGSCASFALHSAGMTTGLVMSVGHGVSFATPVVKGNVINGAVVTTNLGNEDLIKHMQSTLQKECKSQQLDSDIARAVVETICYVSQDYNAERNGEYKHHKTYTLPNGETVNFGKQRFSCPEAFFDTSLIQGCQQDSLLDICRKSLQAADENNEKSSSATPDLWRNIVLVGGSSLMPGLSERLTKEMSKGETDSAFVFSCPKRQYASWRGASMLASLKSSKHRWIDKTQYDEHGATVIHRKFF